MPLPPVKFGTRVKVMEVKTPLRRMVPLESVGPRVPSEPTTALAAVPVTTRPAVWKPLSPLIRVRLVPGANVMIEPSDPSIMTGF